MSDDHQKYLRELISKIKRLTTKEKHHILSIFKKYNVEYTKNSNGYFFNLDKIDIDVLDKVSKCVDLIEEKRELITTLDKKRDSYLQYYKNLIENKLKETINKKREDYIKQLVLVPSEEFIKKKSVKKVARFSNLDPDILMKEHNRPKKYNKNSVYFRINQRIVALSRKFYRPISDKKGDNSGNDNGEEYGDNIYEDNAGSVADNIDDSGDLEGLEDEVQESIGEEYLDGTQNDDVSSNENDDYCDNSEAVDEDEYYKDTNSDTESNTEHKTDKSERSDNKTRTTKTGKKKRKRDVEASSHEIDYYKTLLKQSGFKFDDDKGVQIKLEEYIT